MTLEYVSCNRRAASMLKQHTSQDPMDQAIYEHYRNANFLRELAENLEQISPDDHGPERVRLLHRLANEALEQGQLLEEKARRPILQPKEE